LLLVGEAERWIVGSEMMMEAQSNIHSKHAIHSWLFIYCLHYRYVLYMLYHAGRCNL